MTTYADIKSILDASLGGATIGAHGPFWRSLSRDQFIQFRVFGQQLIAITPSGTFDPANSALMQAIEGRAPFDGSRFKRMPSGGKAPIPAPSIQRIRDWITAGCPA